MAVNVESVQPYREILIKMIPMDVITTCVAAFGFVSAMPAGVLQTVLMWVVFVGGVVAAPLYLKFKHKVTNVVQIVLVTIACFLWMMTIEPGPFSTTFSGYNVAIGATLTILFTGLIAPLIGKLVKK